MTKVTDFEAGYRWGAVGRTRFLAALLRAMKAGDFKELIVSAEWQKAGV